MRAFFFLVSFLGVFPDVYQTLAIPLPNALLIHGEPIGFNTSFHREKRSENVSAPCSNDEYKPRKKNYCCHKCLAGYRVVSDCSRAGERTQCDLCESGTYSDIPNNSKRCMECTTCLTQYGQITVSECKREKDTECGCPEGHFKQYSGQDFTCQECTICRNGTQAFKCHDDKDTICQCFHNFFFHVSDKMCRPCSECKGAECKDHCPDPKAVIRPEESKGLLWIGLAAATIVALVVVVAFGVYIHYTRKHPSPSHNSTDSTGQTFLSNNNKDPGDDNFGNVYTVQHSTQPLLQNGSLPLPDITNVPSPPCLNTPKVMYAIIDNIPLRRWGEFVRRLGLSDHIIETSEKDHRHYSEAQYAMLQVWLTRDGCPTTKRDQLFNVLREINLGGCIDKIEEYL